MLHLEESERFSFKLIKNFSFFAGIDWNNIENIDSLDEVENFVEPRESPYAKLLFACSNLQGENVEKVLTSIRIKMNEFYEENNFRPRSEVKIDLIDTTFSIQCPECGISSTNNSKPFVDISHYRRHLTTLDSH
jgi:hypothetical protein